MPDRKQWTAIRTLFHNKEGKRDLAYILDQADSGFSASERIEWWAMLCQWIRSPIGETQEKSPALRLRFILQLLDRHPDWQEEVADLLLGTLQSSPGFASFAYLGIFEEKGFFDQLADIALARFLPLPLSSGDLTESLERIFPERADADWIETIEPASLQQIMKLIHAAEKRRKQGISALGQLHHDMLLAMQYLSLQIAAVGSTASLWQRLGSPSIDKLPFYALHQEMTQILQRDEADPDSPLSLDGLRQHLRACEGAIRQAFAYMQDHGVNTGLVMRMEQLLLHLRRLELLATQRESEAVGAGPQHALKILAELIRAQYDEHSISHLMGGNLKMLSLRVVEHSGASGEHYIARDGKESWDMLKSAGGGGILTIGTTILKYGIYQIKAPPFIDAILHSGNYVISFLGMQAMHFTLATKQPSMTASALSKKIAQSRGANQGTALAVEIRHIMRSQLIAAIGNVGFAIPTAYLIAWLLKEYNDTPIFDASFALHSIEALHPLKTLTILFAAETGFLLWLSSIAAAWVDNWIAFQKIPERLVRNPRIRRAFGPQAGQAIGSFITRVGGTATGNIMLGIFLGFVPFLGHISGLPLDIRHVTLSSASLAFSAVSLGVFAPWKEIGAAGIGIVLIGVMNFAISFCLAMAVAVRAQGIPRRNFVAIGKRLLQLFKSEPLSFLIPR